MIIFIPIEVLFLWMLGRSISGFKIMKNGRLFYLRTLQGDFVSMFFPIFLQYDIRNKKNQSSTAATSPLLQLALSARVQINPVEIKKCNSDLVLHLWTKYRDVFGRHIFLSFFSCHTRKCTSFYLTHFIFAWHTNVNPATPRVWSQNVQRQHIWPKKAWNVRILQHYFWCTRVSIYYS